VVRSRPSPIRRTTGAPGVDAGDINGTESKFGPAGASPSASDRHRRIAAPQEDAPAPKSDEVRGWKLSTGAARCSGMAVLGFILAIFFAGFGAGYGVRNLKSKRRRRQARSMGLSDRRSHWGGERSDLADLPPNTNDTALAPEERMLSAEEKPLP
jgi:hypothetical protein